MTTVEEIKHVSEQPWSNYSEADYTLEQWHAACLIHQHTGPPTSKGQCKLPVKTPNGALNVNGVHAAAAALAGARGGVNASSEEKAKAARALMGYYSQLNEKAPASLMGLMHSSLDDVLSHYGIKGMKWGVRKDESPPVVAPSKPGFEKSATPDAKRVNKAHQTAQEKGTAALTTRDLQELVNRMNLEQQYSRLSQPQINNGNNFAKTFIQRYGQAELTALFKGKEGPSVRIYKMVKFALKAYKATH